MSLKLKDGARLQSLDSPCRMCESSCGAGANFHQLESSVRNLVHATSVAFPLARRMRRTAAPRSLATASARPSP
jgi:hypothetical protein